MGKLEKIIDYSLIGKAYSVLPAEQTILDNNPTYSIEDWEKSGFYRLKSNIRKHYGRRQRRKCGYCRMTINPDAYGNPIEHIMPRIKKPQWMFVQQNLVVSCVGCNSSKGIDNTLVRHENNYGHSPAHCPQNSAEFKIFNPHFDKWSEHFRIEDDFFLVPIPNSKGPYTYKKCNMHRYVIILDYRDQINMRDKKSYTILTQRLRKEKDPLRKAALEEAKETILDMIENN